MPANDKSSPAGGVPDSVRRAVERTIESTLGSSAQTRERAQDLVDEVLRRAERATKGVREVTDKQREAATGVGGRLRSAVQDLRLATGEDVREIRGALRRLEDRVAKLEKSVSNKPAKKKAASKRSTSSKSKRKS
jgi:polyhydroxyalkanoate synthesis regulator phasin